MITIQTLGRLTAHVRTAAALAFVTMVGACGQPASGPVVSVGSDSLWTDVGEAAEVRWSPGEDLNIQAKITLVDDYGAETVVPALSFHWSKNDLGRLNPDRADKWILVNLATVTIDSPRGVMALAEWCGDENDRILTPRFCGAARSAAEEQWALRPNTAGSPTG